MRNESKDKDADREIKKEIQEIQTSLNDLSLAYEKIKARNNEVAGEEQREREQEDIQVGDKVRITNNIKRNQEREGIVIKINDRSGFFTVRGHKKSMDVRRLRKNLKKIEKFSI